VDRKIETLEKNRKEKIECACQTIFPCIKITLLL
jgi:hypothetical protein